MTLDKNIETLDDLQFELNDNSSDENNQLYLDLQNDEMFF